MRLRRSILAVAVIGVIAVAAKVNVVQNFLRGDGDPIPTGVEGATKNLVRPHSPVLGAAEAKVEIVEFLDPACEGCARMHPRVKRALDTYPGKVRLVIRHLPFHPGADLAVKALEASREQGKYWDVLSAMLDDQREWAFGSRIPAERVMRFMEQLPLDHQRLRADLPNPDYERRLALDLEDAKAAGVIQTPQFFIGGQRLEKTSLEAFDAAVTAAVKRAYP